jgi:hypothetical protein
LEPEQGFGQFESDLKANYLWPQKYLFYFFFTLSLNNILCWNKEIEWNILL